MPKRKEKLALDELNDIKERFSSLSEFTDDLIYIVDKNLNYIFSNKKYRDRTGMKKKDYINKKFLKFHSKRRSKEFALKIKQVIKTGKPIVYEHQSDRDGKYFLSTLNPVRKSKNKPIAEVIVIAKNIEDRKLMEQELERQNEELQKFKLAVEHSTDHITITDKNGVILYSNKMIEKMTGYKLDEVLGKKIGTREIWQGLTSRKFKKKFWRTIKVNKKIFTGEVNNKRKNGERYVSQISIIPLKNSDNKVDFFVGIERDITHLKEIDKVKTEFVSLASHQLRTPLTSIIWYIEMLMSKKHGDLNIKQKDFLEEVYDASNRMSDLVDALLNTSRIDLGTFMISPKTINIKKIIRSLIKELTIDTKLKNQKIKIIFEKKLPLIKADQNLLRIILQNLLSNAMKYTHRGGSIIVKISKKAKNILIEIKDNGYGIPNNQQNKIFTKLFRAENIIQKETNGNGLGLYIVKSIVEAINGKIWFKSKENEGTTFFVSIPLKGMKKREGSRKLNYPKQM